VTASPEQAPPGLTRRILAFAGLPFLSLVTPFLFLPLLARIAGGDAWLAIAVGQSVGAFLALFIALGYNTVGPTMVALQAPADRPDVLRDSIPARVILLLPCLVVAIAISALIAPESQRVEAALMSVAMALTGLSSAWYMIGLGRAGLILVYEIIPRILATASAALLLVVTGQVIWYPGLQVAASVLSGVVFLSRVVGLRTLRAWRSREVGRVLLAQRSAMATESVLGAYNSLAVSFVALGSPGAGAHAYVSGDKVFRISQYSDSALGNSLQGWTVEGGPEEFRPRIRRALGLHLALGVLGLAGFSLLGPWLSGFLFGEAVAIDEPTAVGFGVATLAMALGTAVGRLVLVGLGARREFLIGVIVGAALGVPAILLLSSQFGAAGGAWGLAIGQLASVVTQSVFAVRRWNRPAPAAPDS
jgi:hypothetical protein